MTISGGCLCGQLRYEAQGEPDGMGFCYCADCRKASGSGFIPFMSFAASALTITGRTHQFHSPAMRGGSATRNSCPECGGLVFGCIDLVMDRQGQFHFLEVNQAGQFLFVEELCPDYPVLKAMVALLASGRVDGDLDAFDDVTMAQFRASDDYVALKERADRATGKGPRPELFSLE